MTDNTLNIKILNIEDSEDDAFLVQRELRRSGLNIIWERVETLEALREALEQQTWDVIISDYNLPKFNADEALQIVKHRYPNLPFIVVSGTIGETAAVELMKAGAQDYLMKGSLTRLSEAVRREVRDAEIRAERQRSQLELDLVKERLQLAVEGSGIGLWDWAIQTGEVIINERLAQIFGYTLEELELSGTKTWWELNHSEDSQKAKLAMERHFQKKTPAYECELRKYHKSGAWIWVLSRGKVVEWDQEGKPLRMAGTLLDISDRKQAELQVAQLNRELEDRVEQRTQALQQSEARLREAQQIAHLGSWELDVITNKVSWSEEIFNILALEPHSPTPTYEQFLQFFAPHEQERLKLLHERAINDRQSFTIDAEIICADGSIGYVFVKTEPVWNSAGKVTRLLGIAMDISDRYAMQEALQRSEERTRATLLALPDLVFRVNRAGQYVDFMVSPQGKNLVDPQQIIGQSIYEAFPLPTSGIYAERKHAALQQALTTQTVQIYEQQIQLDGKYFYEEVRVAPCGNDEVVFFVRDISDRKQAEAQLQQTNQELARATRLKDEFLANMSHELRTPLNAILGMAEGLQEQVFGKISDRQLKALQTIESSATHLLELINDILDVSKIVSGQIQLDCAPTAISQLCQSSLAFIRQQAMQKRIQILTKFPLNLPDLLVDERRIRQVLINLLNNAVKFTPEGGNINLEVNCLQVISASPDQTSEEVREYVRIAIVDTGIGIAAENIQKLFKPFVQIDSALNRQYAGTGLGLALVKQIVELHGGKVGISSELGVGSCFSIELPCVPNTTSDSETIVSNQTTEISSLDFPKISKSAPLILIAEDNEANIMTISSYLIAKGYRIVLAKNGEEAILIASSAKPDLILMDIQMPVMDGLEATKQIRQIPMLTNVPIIALTALAMTGDRDRCLEAGANEYLAKPVKLKQLAATIHQLLAT